MKGNISCKIHTFHVFVLALIWVSIASNHPNEFVNELMFFGVRKKRHFKNVPIVQMLQQVWSAGLYNSIQFSLFIQHQITANVSKRFTKKKKSLALTVAAGKDKHLVDLQF